MPTKVSVDFVLDISPEFLNIPYLHCFIHVYLGTNQDIAIVLDSSSEGGGSSGGEWVLQNGQWVWQTGGSSGYYQPQKTFFTNLVNSVNVQSTNAVSKFKSKLTCAIFSVLYLFDPSNPANNKIVFDLAISGFVCICHIL